MESFPEENKRNNDGEHNEEYDSVSLCVVMPDLQKKIAKEISGGQFEYFLEFYKDAQMQKKLDEIVPVPLQELFDYSIDVSACLSTPMTLESLKSDFKCYRLTKREIHFLWESFQKYLIKDGKLCDPSKSKK